MSPVIVFQPRDSWRDDLLTHGKPPIPTACHANYKTILTGCPLFVGKFRFNTLSAEVDVVGELPWDRPTHAKTWNDQDDIELTCWLNKLGIRARPRDASEAMLLAAHANSYNPLQDYLNGLDWHGHDYVGDWLTYYLKVGRCTYSMETGRTWLVSAVARALNPGCQVDCCIVLEGEQGTYKSSALRILGGEYFTDAPTSNLNSKDSMMLCRGAWIVELSELESLSRTTLGATKAFLSRREDRYRPPYGTHPQTFRRACVFAGTTNSDEYLIDPTGARRFLPVKCGLINKEALERDRDQLWAQAVAIYKSSDNQWWLDKSMNKIVSAEQAKRFTQHPWLGPITEYIGKRNEITVEAILTHCLKIERGQWKRDVQMDVVNCLKALKFNPAMVKKRRIYRRSHLSY